MTSLEILGLIAVMGCNQELGMSGLVLKDGNSGVLEWQEVVLPSPATAIFILSLLREEESSPTQEPI